MAEIKLKESLKRLRDFIMTLRDSDLANGIPEEAFPTVIFSAGEWGTMMLWGDLAEEYLECVSTAYSTVEKQKQLSYKGVEEVVGVAILSSLDPLGRAADKEFPQRLDDALAVLEQALRAAPQEWEIHLPVLGLSPQGLPHRIGDVEFYVADEPTRSGLKERAEAFLMKTRGTAEARLSASRFNADRLDKNMAGNIYAKLTVRAIDRDAAIALATMLLRQVTTP